MNRTKIEWTDVTWNPVTGCSPVSEGCENCYARRLAFRLRGRFGYPDDEPFKVTLHPELLEEPLRWRKPRRVFVCSMGDLFHPDVPDHFIARVWSTMRYSPHHTYIILTKRPERMAEWFEKIWCYEWEGYMRFGHEKGDNGTKGYIIGVADRWPLPNVWIGVTAENQARAEERIPVLLKIPAVVRFVSVEPMLGPVDLRQWLGEARFCERHGQLCEEGVSWENGQLVCRYCKRPVERLRLLHWVIAGGETGPDARPMNPTWVRSLRDQCIETETSFFFKSWGEWAPSKPFVIDHAERIEKGLPPVKKYLILDSGLSEEDMKRDRGIRAAICGRAGITMAKVDKRSAGRLLDGREWNQFPTPIPPQM
jgi:protein gp37